GELVEQPAGRGAGGLALQHLAQVLGVIVVAQEDHVADAALAESEQYRGELRRERGIEDQRQGGEQQAQALQLLRAWLSGERRVQNGELNGARPDARQPLAPALGAHESK